MTHHTLQRMEPQKQKSGYLAMESFSAETNSTDLYLEPQYQPQTILAMAILGLTFILGLPGNGLVLWVAGLKMRRTVNTVWFLHLTLADFLCCLSLPLSMAHLALQGYWPYGNILCKLIPSIIILNMFASVFLLTAISLDRCLLVLKPIWCQNHRSVRTACAICGCIWLVAFVLCTPVFMYRETSTVDSHTVCTYNFGPMPFDYSGEYAYDSDALDHDTPDPTIQLPGEMERSSDPSAFQTHHHPWSVTTLVHSPPSQQPSEDSFRMGSTKLPSQLESAGVGSAAALCGPPAEENGTNTLNNSALLSTDLDLFPYASRNCLSTPEPSQDFEDYLNPFAYEQQVPIPLMAITFTRLVVGFLLPTIIMMACYALIVFRMRRIRIVKSRNKAFHLAVVVVTVFLVCWTPYHVFGVLTLFTDVGSPLGEALLSWDCVSIALASANSCFNPFLYALLGRDLRRQARQSMKGILEAAFTEDVTKSTSCTQTKAFSEKDSFSTNV
ncbi:PREDICTED: C3a anaphylatoxin chemotactic receptor isoform X2 [Chinchilla lanigera]|uniref:C3a anaphylatoxin chemotactic receptor isoform X2 n=1 Tax=Chinchilla lanigera TaxID=34839 RepID=UPI0006983648|nr:PREDICTED: C3a anaphylatoxin chemotactic receptor isoform X2 [Chinchilla lanigera]